MNRAFKTLLLWLLIAALPLQGGAAAMQLTCGPAHHNAAQLVHAMDGHAQHGATVFVEVASGSSGASANADKLPASCSACAACCVGASAPPSVPVLTPAYGSSGFAVDSHPPLFTGFIPAGLERPPKPLSA
jgi:hypothetical protein